MGSLNVSDFRGQRTEKHCLNLTVSEVCEVCVFVFVLKRYSSGKSRRDDLDHLSVAEGSSYT